MNVSGVAPGALQATTMSGASRVGGPGSENRMQSAIGAAAQLFGMSAQDLTAALSSGQSMASVAAAKGISSSTLLSTVKSAIQQAAPQGSTGPTGAVLERIAKRITDHTGPVHRRHRAPGAAPTVLGTSTPGAAPPGTATTGAISAGSPDAATTGFDVRA